MKVAKLNTGKLVWFFRYDHVQFAEGTWALIAPHFNKRLRANNELQWVPSTDVVWVLDFGRTEHDGAATESLETQD